MNDQDASDLTQQIASLPTELPEEDEEAKRFDLLMLRLQLARLNAEPSFVRLSKQVRAIAGLLEEQSSIPMIRDQMPLIQEVQTDEFWRDVTLPMLERARRRLRLLVKLIEKAKRRPVYTDFEDVMGEEATVDLPRVPVATDFERFRAKARQFLRAHHDHLTIYKLRANKPLTRSDLDELERMLIEAGAATPGEISRAKAECQGLGLFIRSLIGLDRGAAKQAFAGFLEGKAQTANQIEFVNLIIDHLTEHGVVDPRRLYESPFTDISPRGPEGLFGPNQVDELVAVLDEIRRTAAA